MNGEVGELYQEMVLEHSGKPRNFGRLENATATVEGFNPLCGDQLVLDVRLEGDRVQALAFQGHGCAIFRASASLMTEALRGRTVEEADRVFEAFHALVTRGAAGIGVDLVPLGKLVALSGVHEFPSRVKCAALAWHALRAALHGGGRVSTETGGARGGRA